MVRVWIYFKAESLTIKVACHFLLKKDMLLTIVTNFKHFARHTPFCIPSQTE